MNEASTELLTLAKRIAGVYATQPNSQAIIVMGSAAEGHADFYSDLDMSVYYSELPAEVELEVARQQNGGTERNWLLGDREAGAMAESYQIDGVECQVVHVTIAAWERDMATVLEQCDVTTPLQKALSGILTCIPLYGDPLVQNWKAIAAHYPDELAQAMVAHYLNFVPVWSKPERFLDRDGALWMHQILVEAEYNLIGILAGLNRLYYSTFQFKRMDAFLGKMEIAPPGLSNRLKRLLTSEPHDIVDPLNALIRETVDLVELHMPTIDTTQIRRQLETRQQEWKQ